MENNQKLKSLISLALESFIDGFNEEMLEKGNILLPSNVSLKISITGFQRKLNIGFSSARKLMELLITNDAVVEDNGRYFIVSFYKYCELLKNNFKEELPFEILFNPRGNNIEKSLSSSEYVLARVKQRNKYFKKKGDYVSSIIDDTRSLIEKNIEFNIPKQEIMSFFDDNKTQIYNLFNLNSNIVEEDFSLMARLDYDEKVFVDNNGKISSCIKIYPTTKKIQEGLCLCLFANIIKMLWNKQNKQKIYFFKIKTIPTKVFGEELQDFYINDIYINSNSGDLPF